MLKQFFQQLYSRYRQQQDDRRIKELLAILKERSHS